MITITMGTVSFDLSDAYEKALYWDIYELRDWIENAIQVKISTLADGVIIANTNKDPNKMTYSEKLIEVSNISGFVPGSVISISLNKSGILPVDLSTTETGILELDDVGIKTLIEDTVTTKAKDTIDWIVKDNTDQRIETLTDVEKETIVNNATILSAQERMQS